MSPEPRAAATVEELAATREALRSELEQIDWRSPDSPLARNLRERLQLATVQLAVSEVRRDIPAAASLVLTDSEEGQGQGGYEILMALGSDGSILQSVSVWIRSACRTPVAGDKSPSLADLAWSIPLNDDSWAEGIADLKHSALSGKTATIDIDAALAKPAPPRPGNRGALISQLEATRNVLDIMREQTRQAEAAHRLASLRLAAATILERFPDAATMELTPDPCGSGRLQIRSIDGAEGALYTSGWDGTRIVDGRGEDGTPSVNELISGVGQDFPEHGGGPVQQSRGHIVVDLLAVCGPA